ncbi:MAG: hypothetical protein HXX15_18225 [Rhodopseudomonas sp.]|uniref:hypothetical protein n=1 Tax=Rhodopseudomonas sp. TaxID=1078 RepID=UPI00185D714B|nr:hypothetical protein [Rhodopseudomonas sp.]NVN88020.1 hypothetical protein [Rhodopseudomonas sp.]
MSQTLRGMILGVIAITSTLGAAQLAAGGDLTQIGLRTEPSPTQDINRAAKSDRADGVRQHHPSQTVSVNLADQSIVVRIPVGQAGPSQDLLMPPVNARRAMVACEPPVSVLTEVAKLLQPGRCVT